MNGKNLRQISSVFLALSLDLLTHIFIVFHFVHFIHLPFDAIWCHCINEWSACVCLCVCELLALEKKTCGSSLLKSDAKRMWFFLSSSLFFSLIMFVVRLQFFSFFFSPLVFSAFAVSGHKNCLLLTTYCQFSKTCTWAQQMKCEKNDGRERKKYFT